MGKQSEDGLIGAASSGAIAIQHGVVPGQAILHATAQATIVHPVGIVLSRLEYVGVTRLTQAGLFAILQTMQREHWV